MFRELKLRKIRINEQEKLNSGSLALYKVITNNIQNSELRNVEKEEILQDILDMMLQVEAKNKPVEAIVGDDYREFCESVVDEYLMSKPRIYRVLNFIQKYIVLIMVISFLMIIPTMLSKGTGDSKIAMSSFIYANAIALFIVPFTKKANRKSLSSSINSYIPNFYTGRVMDNDKDKLLKVWFLICIGVLGINILFNNIIGINLSTHYIYPLRYIAVVAGMIIIAASIEIYKRVYDKK